MSEPVYALDAETLAFIKRRALAQQRPPAGTTRDPENEAYIWARRCLDVIALLEDERARRGIA